MMLALTGSPGTGKSSIAAELEKRGFLVVHVNDTIEDYVLEHEAERDTRVVDVEAWADDFKPFDGIVEGHISHFLDADRIVVLRCRPDLIEKRLSHRNYSPEKVKENMEAEMLDVILVEAAEEHDQHKLYELDTTEITITQCADLIQQIYKGMVTPSHGNVNWLDWMAQNL